MEFKGTKGEWDAVHNGYFCDIKVDGQNIASTQSNVYLGITDTEEYANAKLISCAPEMLEMLAELKNRLEYFNDKVSVFDIEALIKKATTI